MFIDLHLEVLQLTSKGLENRLTELASKLPKVAIYAVGGFPIEKQYPLHIWNGVPVEDIKYAIKKALGTSAILTYTNPKNKMLGELGHLCVEKGHNWAYHWMTVSMVLANYPLVVEMAFAHDTRFQLSWPIQKEPSGKVFGVNGTIKDWLDFTKHRDDLSFDENTRQAMHACHDILKEILPTNDDPQWTPKCRVIGET